MNLRQIGKIITHLFYNSYFTCHSVRTKIVKMKHFLLKVKRLQLYGVGYSLNSMTVNRLLTFIVAFYIHSGLNSFTANPVKAYTLPYWSNPPLLIFDIRALWRSGLSARAPECQKLKMVG